MKYNEFVKKVERYGWVKTKFYGLIFFRHYDKDKKIDRSDSLYDLKKIGAYDKIFEHMRNYDLFTMEKLNCIHCGGKVHYDELVPDENVQYTLKCECTEFRKYKRWKAKIPDYWVEAKEEEVEA